MLLSILSLVAILVVLLVYQDRLVDDWPFPITINAFIAVFIVLLKAGLTISLSNGASPPLLPPLFITG